LEVEEREGPGVGKLILTNGNRVKEDVHPVAEDAGVKHGTEAIYETR